MSFTDDAGSAVLTTAAGDKRAFTQTFHYYYPRLCFFANRFLFDKEAAEDVVQTVFIKFWELREQIYPYAVKRWLYLATRNAALNYLRQQERKEKHHEAILEKTGEEYADFVLNQMVRAEVLGELHHQINALPTKCAEIFRLHMNSYSNEEIAALLGLSIHTVKNQLARGRELLRLRLNRDTVLALLLFFPNFFD